MQKNIYLWIFIGLAIILCSSMLVIAGRLYDKNEIISQPGVTTNVNSEAPGNIDSPNVVQEDVDLTVEGVDFEEDAVDLSDDFIDDSSFDSEPSLDSVENEIY